MFMEAAQQYDKPFSSVHGIPSADERWFWDGLDPEFKGRLIRSGEAFLHYDYPVIRAVDYLEFSRNGNREHYEQKLFSRRTALDALVLAECAENKGRFLDDILNGIYVICEESAWQLPAHNSYVRDAPQLPLPDVTRPVLDLFCAETGAVLSAVIALMKSRLDAVSPAVCVMIRQELTRRVLIPYEQEHFWWMGDGVSPMNNWTVWCTQNVLLTAFCGLELSQDERRSIFLKACQSIDYFQAEYGEDGCCDEGAQYYRHAGLCLFGCLELLNAITDGHFLSLYENEKIRNIAAYILNVHVAQDWYINFSDCSPAAGRCGAREFLFGKRTGNRELMKLAALDYRQGDDPLTESEHNLFYRLLTAVCHDEMKAYPTDSPIRHRDIFYPSVGLFLVRDSRYVLAVKAGDNDDSHNHNDTGSFTIYKDQQPLFVDIGVETYQKKTFSSRRYEIWTMQSQYHNLPGFRTGNRLIQQQNGPQYAARDLNWELSGSCPFISMELAGAYPDVSSDVSPAESGVPCSLTSYRRRASLEKENGIFITDTVQCSGLTPVLSLITYEKPIWDEASSCLILGDLGTCRITGAADVRTERLPITDKRLQAAWKHDLWRTLAIFEGTSLQLEIH